MNVPGKKKRMDRKQLIEWIDEAVMGGCTHVAILQAQPAADNRYFPVYAAPGQDIRSLLAAHKAKGDTIIEIYSLNISLVMQLDPNVRAFNLS